MSARPASKIFFVVLFVASATRVMGCGGVVEGSVGSGDGREHHPIDAMAQARGL